MSQTQIDLNRLKTFSNLELIAKQIVEGFITGLHKSPFHGFSVEFAEYKPYNTGESTRNVDWKLYARTDKLFVKQFEEETNLRAYMILDVSSSMFFPQRNNLSLDNPNKIYFSVYAAAAIMQIMKSQRDAVGLSLFSDKVVFHSHCKSSALHHKSLYMRLEELLTPIPVTEQHNTNITDALHEIAERIHRRSLVVIFTDAFDTHSQEELFLALQHLRHNKHEVILFHVYDKNYEIDFNFDNKPYKFIDVETAQMLKVNAAETRLIYKKAIEAFRNELKVRCGQYQVDLVETDINSGFNQLLMTYLLKRERMY
ncbi:MAG: DUF58 domain-containing protein [Bacteroidales bacterium]|jgi:uncharacterized protein (DUF58 family)|nr:DUF58 domain-containing protein [Bacteroidales bacterium]